MVLVVDPHSGVPVYRQVMGQIKFLIAGGVISPGDELPPPESLSAQLGVNPSTVTKAYGRLVDQGILRRRRGRPVVLRVPARDQRYYRIERPGPHSEQSREVRARLGLANAEAARILSDPLVEQCFQQFAGIRHRSLERDLEKASQVQEVLLPPRALSSGGWSAAYHYDAYGPTSGDYCDLIKSEAGDLYFVVGDVMGKGFAASLLMAHLHASIRTLIPMDMPLPELISRVNRAFCEATPDCFFATLACGHASASGEVEICNAGHPAPIVLSKGPVQEVAATGLPLGLFPDQDFTAINCRLGDGDTILVYSDGVSEARNNAGDEYGPERLTACVRLNRRLPPDGLIEACKKDLGDFRGEAPQADDVTMLAIHRSGYAKRDRRLTELRFRSDVGGTKGRHLADCR
jgi:sigma-B regulation protein RsbU (phosphoserine phosphatase)